MIFVFGSNLRGAHGGGAAYEAAQNFGAEDGVGVGPTGRAYAIPTMDENFGTLCISDIKGHVSDFLDHAQSNPRTEFFVTAIGCGIAGFDPREIAPMFANAPRNCTLHRRLVECLNGEAA